MMATDIAGRRPLPLDKLTTKSEAVMSRYGQEVIDFSHMYKFVFLRSETLGLDGFPQGNINYSRLNFRAYRNRVRDNNVIIGVMTSHFIPAVHFSGLLELEHFSEPGKLTDKSGLMRIRPNTDMTERVIGSALQAGIPVISSLPRRKELVTDAQYALLKKYEVRQPHDATNWDEIRLLAVMFGITLGESEKTLINVFRATVRHRNNEFSFVEVTSFIRVDRIPAEDVHLCDLIVPFDVVGVFITYRYIGTRQYDATKILHVVKGIEESPHTAIGFAAPHGIGKTHLMEDLAQWWTVLDFDDYLAEISRGAVTRISDIFTLYAELLFPGRSTAYDIVKINAMTARVLASLIEGTRGKKEIRWFWDKGDQVIEIDVWNDLSLEPIRFDDWVRSNSEDSTKPLLVFANNRQVLNGMSLAIRVLNTPSHEFMVVKNFTAGLCSLRTRPGAMFMNRFLSMTVEDGIPFHVMSHFLKRNHPGQEGDQIRAVGDLDRADP